jgi:hypothetical protein
MTRPLSVIAIALIGVIMASTTLAQNRDNGNGAKVGKDGFMLNVIAFEQCPSGDFLNSNRHQIAVQANYAGHASNKTAKVNKIFLKQGEDFWVQDGNACDNGANFYLPITDANCSNCGDLGVEPAFTEYEVFSRLVGQPGGKVTVTGCVEVIMIDPITLVETVESLCSTGNDNIWVETRTVGRGKEQNKWDNVSTELLTVCVDTDGDGICDKRVGLFDSFGEDYWWNWGAQGRPHVQLVFIPVRSGGS